MGLPSATAASTSRLIAARCREDALVTAEDWADLARLARTPLASRLSLSAYSEKQLVFALRATCRRATDPKVHMAAADALAACVEGLGFRPKIEVMASSFVDAEACLEPGSPLLSGILQAYSLACVACPPRRAFDVCVAATIESLLRLWLHQEHRELVNGLLQASLFYDVRGSLAKAMQSRQVLAASVHRNDEVVHPLLSLVARIAQSRTHPSGSLSVLCELLYQVHPSLACSFWFECIVAAKSHDADELVLGSLFDHAHLWYSPTNTEDVCALKAWTAALLASGKVASAHHFARVLERIIRLDPRAVDLIRVLELASVHASIDLVLVSLSACADARTVPKWMGWLASMPSLNSIASALSDDAAVDAAVQSMAAHLGNVLPQQVGDVWAAMEECRFGMNSPMVELALQALCVGCRITTDNAEQVAERLLLIKTEIAACEWPWAPARINTLHALNCLCVVLARPEISYGDIVKSAVEFALQNAEFLQKDSNVMRALARCALHSTVSTAQMWAIGTLAHASAHGDDRASRLLVCAPFAVWMQISSDVAALVWQAILVGGGEAQALLGRAWFYESLALRSAGAKQLKVAMQTLHARTCLLVAQLPLGYINAKAAAKLIKASRRISSEKEESTWAHAVLVASLSRQDALLVLKGYKDPNLLAHAVTTATASSESVAVALVSRYVRAAPAPESDAMLVNLLAKRPRLVALALDDLSKCEAASEEATGACAKIVSALKLGVLALGDDELLLVASVLRARNRVGQSIGEGSVMLGPLLLRAAESLNLPGAAALIEATALTFRRYRPALPPGLFSLLAAACLVLNGAHGQPAALQNLASNARAQQLGYILDAALKDARLGGSAEALAALDGLACICGAVRAGGASAAELSRRSSSVLQCLARAGHVAGILALVGNQSCQHVDLDVVLGAVNAGKDVANGAAVLRAVWERHPQAALVCVGALCSSMRMLQTLAVEQSDFKALSELKSLAADMHDKQGVMRHHVVGLLAHHVSLCFFRRIPEAVRRPVQLYGYHLLDLCGDDELQQLHTLLGGGAGGARRDAFGVLVKEWRAKHRYEGAT